MMEKDYGEPLKYDPNFNGPVHNRSCTDIIWLILFIAFLGVWGFVGYYGMKNGDIHKLLAPVDSKGRRCGLDAGLKDKKYLVFFDIQNCLSPATPITGCPTPQVCVKECPTTTIDFNSMTEETTFNQYKSSIVCTEEVNTSTMTLSQAKRFIDEKKCAGTIMKSQAVLFRCIGDLSSLQCKRDVKPALQNSKCLQDPSEARTSLLNKATALDTYVGWFVASWMTFFTSSRNERDTQILSGQIVHDLVETRWFLLGAFVVVIILCFIYILLLRWIVLPVVWTSLIGLLALLAFSTYLCYKNYIYYRDNVTLHQTTNLIGYLKFILSKSETWMAFLVITAIILVILLLIVIFLRSRINIAVALIREGSKSVTAIKSTIFFPIIPWIIQCFVIAYGALVLMHLWSMGESVFKVVSNNATKCPCIDYKDDMNCNPVEFILKLSTCPQSNDEQCKDVRCHFTGLDSPTSVVWLHLVNMLGFFWTMFFISGLSDMILASTFSTWYWTRIKRNLPFFTLTSGILRTLRYHPGTVALGSLIIAIVRVIRVILEFIDKKLKKFDNSFTRCVMCFCKCLCWCLENFLKFINKNAYIMCAVHGYSFCKSAREAFSILMRNIVRTVVLDKVTDFLFFLSKLLISIGVGFAAYYLLEWEYLHKVTKIETLHYNYIPAIILSIATYLISTIFFKVYEMAVDTLFLCFLEDCERNDGSPEKPYFMSKHLMKILGKKNKKLN